MFSGNYAATSFIRLAPGLSSPWSSPPRDTSLQAAECWPPGVNVFKLFYLSPTLLCLSHYFFPSVSEDEGK
jgi:hypothetical protein